MLGETLVISWELLRVASGLYAGIHPSEDVDIPFIPQTKDRQINVGFLLILYVIRFDHQVFPSPPLA